MSVFASTAWSGHWRDQFRPGPRPFVPEVPSRRVPTSGRVGRALLAAALLVGALSIADRASAVHDTGAFELDGNAVNDAVAGDDWDNVCHQVTITNDPGNAIPDECGGAANANTATAVAWAVDGTGKSIFTGGGSKDPQHIADWLWKDGSVPDKDNLVHGFAARYSLTPNATTCPSGGAPTCEILFFGSDRFDNSGDAQQGFWFFQNAIGLTNTKSGGGFKFSGEHADGDLLIISDFSNGGTVSTINVYEWDEATPGHLKALESIVNGKCDPAVPGTDAVCAIVNPGPGLTTSPWTFLDKSGNSNFANGELYEGGINLSLLGLSDRCFSSVASETRSSTSTTATLKDFVLGGFGHCGSGLVTTPKASDGTTNANPAGLSIGAGSVGATDSANLTVTGTQTWGGNVAFHLCGPIASPATCATGGVQIGSSVGVTQATTQPVVSSVATLTSAGRYCWRADFTSTTTGVPDASDSGDPGECFTVNPVTPTLDTAAVASPVDNGQPVQDNATLSGTATQPGTNGGNATYPSINATNGAPAGGKITFTLLKADCSTNATGTGTNPQDFTPISGDNTYGPVSFTPDGPGTYHWKAQYVVATGDVNNIGSTHNGSCNDSDETVVVNQVTPVLTTRQFTFPQDKAKLTASSGGDLAGSLSFKLYSSSANCTANGATGLLYSEGPIAVSGASPQFVTTSNTSYRAASDAILYWRVTYTSTNPAQTGTSSECVENATIDYTGNDDTITFP